MATKWYPVYKLKYNIALADPDMPPGRFHHAIFVERKADGSGILYHVVGDITSRDGMTYQSRNSGNPATSRSFNSKEFLGYTPVANQKKVWDNILSPLPTPPQQKAANPEKQGRVEPFKEKLGPYSFNFYEDGEERAPLWKCTEWVEQYAIPTLQRAGLLQSEGDPVSTLDQLLSSVPASSYGYDSTDATLSQGSEWVWDESTQLYKYWDAAAGRWILQE